MSKAPNPIEIINFENSETIELENNQNKKLKFIISNNSSLIQLIVEDLISFPKQEYFFVSTLEELQKLNRYFLFFQNIKEVSQTLIKLSKNKNLNIIIENNICKIIIKNQINDEEFIIELSKKEKDIKQEIESFIPLMLELKNKNEKLENENNLLKQKNENLENKNQNLVKRFLKLEKKYVNLKNQLIKMEKKYENLINQYTKIEKKYKNLTIQLIKKINSNIINDEEKIIILNYIPANVISTELLFDTDRDGDSINSFKNKCEVKRPTLVIIQTTTGIIFGGYASKAWIEGRSITDYNSFIFSLEPPKKYNVISPENALFGYRYNDIMFQFGCCCFQIKDNCTIHNDNYIYGADYEGGFKNIFKGGKDERYFTVKRMEIFLVNY